MTNDNEKFKKTRDFISQLPTWEKKYIKNNKTYLGYEKKDGKGKGSRFILELPVN